MCQKPWCSHEADLMCSCEAMKTGCRQDMERHMVKNMGEFKLELFYGMLEDPAPYRLCMTGVCKVCGGRLCSSVELPDHLYGDGLLAVVYHHMKHLYPDDPGQFTALFHEEDRPAVQRWLDRNLSPAQPEAISPDQSEPGETIRFYTIVQTQSTPDCISFPVPVVKGTYLTLDFARKELKEMIARAKENLNSLCDAEEERKDFWEAFDAGHIHGCYLQLQIKSAELTLAASEHWIKDCLEKEGPRHE